MMWDVKPDQTSSSYQNSAARARSLCGLVLGRGNRLRSKNRGHICSSPSAVCAQGSPGCGVWIPSKGQCRFVPSPQPFSPQLPAGALQSWGVLMHSHPCLKPEELTGIFPSLRGFPPAQIKASFHSVGQGGFPVQSHTWDVSPEHSNICKSFQCLHPFLTPSQLSFGQAVGWSQETPSCPLEVSWGPAQLSSLACGVQAGSQIQNSPSMLGASAAVLRILPAFISSGAVSFPTLFPCAWKTRELPSSFPHLLPRGFFSCKGKRETLTHKVGWMGCPCSRGAPRVSDPDDVP